MDEYDEEEFERLCEQELELMNEMQNYENKKNSINETHEIDFNG